MKRACKMIRERFFVAFDESSLGVDQNRLATRHTKPLKRRH
jgi:hypothetical protein